MDGDEPRIRVIEGRGSWRSRALIALLDELRCRHPIVDVVGHDDVAPGRKTDPGPCFDWKRLRDSRS